MSGNLVTTNMTPEEVVPDTMTEGHDPRFWCLPPMREDLNAAVRNGGGYEFYLVTQGRKVGVWRNWTVAKAMISGYPDNAHKGHHSYAACVVEWQAHCPLGVHPHPGDPQWNGDKKGKQSTSRGETTSTTLTGTAPTTTDAPARRAPRRSSSLPDRRRTSGTLVAAGGTSSLATSRYFAIFGMGVVYSTNSSSEVENSNLQDGP
ncbi:hypothetical protein B0H13DRAFT_2348906 [Mycena leptocephala]|nr:hypothetical protein B0H13DRAFT_2349138 [Mycena leptocephala]KAJ7873670.1 hypothetical protein B0H13DRAFT_2348906 [Mycena leptocephala]